MNSHTIDERRKHRFSRCRIYDIPKFYNFHCADHEIKQLPVLSTAKIIPPLFPQKITPKRMFDAIQKMIIDAKDKNLFKINNILNKCTLCL